MSLIFPSVVLREDDNNRLSCVVDDEVFRIPNDYSRIGGQSADQVRRQYGDDDDQLLQYAIRQSVSGGEIAAAGNSTDASTGAIAGATANGSVVGAAKNKEEPADKSASTEGNPGNADTEEVDIWEALQVSFVYGSCGLGALYSAEHIQHTRGCANLANHKSFSIFSPT